MSKNIVICCDGTGNQFGATNSNVVKLYQVIERHPRTQLGYYDPGVGTMGAVEAIWPWTKKLTFVFGLAFGYGLERNVCEAYQYLMTHFQPEDKVFIFGFSRGAYTARVLAGMLHKCGLLERGSDNQLPYVYRMFKQRGNDGIAHAYKRTFSRECKPHFVGVWDTVSTVGWVYNPVTFPFSAHNPDILYFRHAISIDEKRTHFRTNLFYPEDQDCKQVWFAGVHSDVGGGYREAESALAKIPLKWMIDEARAKGLAIDLGRYYAIVLGKGDGTFVAPQATGKLHNSLTWAWGIVERLPRMFKIRENGVWTTRFKWSPLTGLNEPRPIAAGATVHQSVLDRMSGNVGYAPVNLPEKRVIEPYTGDPLPIPDGALIIAALKLAVDRTRTKTPAAPPASPDPKASSA